MATGYEETYRRSLADPSGFWGQAAESLEWERRWDRVLDDSRPPFYRWFVGGRLNTCLFHLRLKILWLWRRSPPAWPSSGIPNLFEGPRIRERDRSRTRRTFNGRDRATKAEWKFSSGLRAAARRWLLPRRS